LLKLRSNDIVSINDLSTPKRISIIILASVLLSISSIGANNHTIICGTTNSTSPLALPTNNVGLDDQILNPFQNHLPQPAPTLPVVTDPIQNKNKIFLLLKMYNFKAGVIPLSI
jgi:hypothetical protein